MAKKLTKEKAKERKMYHEKRVKFYAKKEKELEKREKRIGFVWYD